MEMEKRENGHNAMRKRSRQQEIFLVNRIFLHCKEAREKFRFRGKPSARWLKWAQLCLSVSQSLSFSVAKSLGLSVSQSLCCLPHGDGQRQLTCLLTNKCTHQEQESRQETHTYTYIQYECKQRWKAKQIENFTAAPTRTENAGRRTKDAGQNVDDVW